MTFLSHEQIRQRRFGWPRARQDRSDPLQLDDKLWKADQQQQKRRLLHRFKSFAKGELAIVTCLTLWSFYIRLWKIWQPNSVVFDEVHFGGFASKYIKTRFFMDVHPPLAKMLIALVAKIAGFDGGFDFKEIGLEYVEVDVPFVAIRMFCGLLGALAVPMAYLTMKKTSHSTTTALLVSAMLCYENGLITNNRLILLDPILLFFTSATTLAWVNFRDQQKNSKPFNAQWCFWLGMSGLGMGLTASCKWVGLFTIATIGAPTIKSLWDIWGNTQISSSSFLRHFFFRAIFLIALPIAVYMAMFAVHFYSLPNSGEGDAFMSPEFQQTLAGSNSRMGDTPLDIAYGSKVWIRHEGTRGGYLHSHPHDYPTGSGQQQITLYPHKDENNWWIIEKSRNAPRRRDTMRNGEVEYVKDGDRIRLVHALSGKRLHSHDQQPPLANDEYHKEVSAYGYPEYPGDANDDWFVDIVAHDGNDLNSKERLRTIHSRFRLVHTTQHCALFSHNVKLPEEWGFGQQEVTCMQASKLPKTIWYIEANENLKLPEDAETVNYKYPGFLAKFIELNKVMWDVNNGLTASHPYDSRPQAWPLLQRGISFWGKDGRHIYLLGNPAVFWGSSAAIVGYVAMVFSVMVMTKRGYRSKFQGMFDLYNEAAGFFLTGWCAHYFPFYLMDRQLFLHHYMPALYYAVLLFGSMFDLSTVCLTSRKRMFIAAIAGICVIYTYRNFIPITYGEPWSQTSCESAKWTSSWDFDCAQ
ncbi:glycosyltransferase family 39 protein [Zychaea mexicana]|uniref:glycosyltransferase family 39 protein n=1 Tax=Zychaea mexicana TaxID=64656 RepID=UPI0022FDF207|nr:glycosyltransferase family 39 protein [Zychaea mexicana]KAI9467856.1 glycosyltransferase family 39 protein [Zychaea mexicana]